MTKTRQTKVFFDGCPAGILTEDKGYYGFGATSPFGRRPVFRFHGHLLPLKGDEVGMRLDATVFGGVKEAIQQT